MKKKIVIAMVVLLALGVFGSLIAINTNNNNGEPVGPVVDESIPNDGFIGYDENGEPIYYSEKNPNVEEYIIQRGDEESESVKEPTILTKDMNGLHKDEIEELVKDDEGVKYEFKERDVLGEIGRYIPEGQYVGNSCKYNEETGELDCEIYVSKVDSFSSLFAVGQKVRTKFSNEDKYNGYISKIEDGKIYDGLNFEVTFKDKHIGKFIVSDFKNNLIFFKIKEDSKK